MYSCLLFTAYTHTHICFCIALLSFWWWHKLYVFSSWIHKSISTRSNRKKVKVSNQRPLFILYTFNFFFALLSPQLLLTLEWVSLVIIFILLFEFIRCNKHKDYVFVSLFFSCMFVTPETSLAHFDEVYFTIFFSRVGGEFLTFNLCISYYD